MAVRIQSAEVRYILTEYTEGGEPSAEYKSEPVRVFRVVHPDIWTHGDALAFPKDAAAIAVASDATTDAA